MSGSGSRSAISGTSDISGTSGTSGISGTDASSVTSSSEAFSAAAGGAETDLANWHKVMHNYHVNVAVTGFFLIAVAVIVGGCAWEWARLLTGRKAVVLKESPYVTLPDPA